MPMQHPTDVRQDPDAQAIAWLLANANPDFLNDVLAEYLGALMANRQQRVAHILWLPPNHRPVDQVTLQALFEVFASPKEVLKVVGMGQPSPGQTALRLYHAPVLAPMGKTLAVTLAQQQAWEVQRQTAITKMQAAAGHGTSWVKDPVNQQFFEAELAKQVPLYPDDPTEAEAQAARILIDAWFGFARRQP